MVSADGAQVAFDCEADHRHAAEAEHQRVGHRDDLADARLDQSLHPLAHRGLREADLRSASLRVRQAAVVLERLDERLVDVVEDDGAVGRLRHEHDDGTHALARGARDSVVGAGRGYMESDCRRMSPDNGSRRAPAVVTLGWRRAVGAPRSRRVTGRRRSGTPASSIPAELDRARRRCPRRPTSSSSAAATADGRRVPSSPAGAATCVVRRGRSASASARARATAGWSSPS